MAVLTSKLIVALVDQVTAPSRAVSAAINRMTAASQANAARMAEVRGKMLDATAAGWALWRGLSAPVNAAMQFESAMADVRKVVDFPTPEAFQEMGDDIRRLSTKIPMAADGIAAIVAAAGQSGLAVDELLPFAEMAAKVGVAWEVSADNAGEALAKLKTALGMSVAETGLLADAINHLGNNIAASAPDILDVVRRVGAQASQFGLSAEQAAAFGAAMVGAGAESEVAATSFRNMGRALTRGASATKRQSAAYKTLGLDAQNVAADMQRDAVGTITNVLERIRAVPAEARAALITDLFGDEARAIGPLITNTELLADALGLVANRAEYAGSAAEEYAVRAKTSENNLQLFRNQITSLAISIGNALLPAMNDILALVGPMISSFSDLASRFPNITRGIVGVATALIGFRVAAIAAQYAGLFLKGALLDAGIAALTAARAIGSMALAPAGAAIMALRNPLRLVTAAFYALRVAIISTGVGALLAGIALAGAWIYNNWTGITIAFEAFKGAFLRAIAPIMPALQPVADGLAWLRDAVMALIAPVDEMGGSWAAAGIAAGKFVGEALTAVVGFTTDLVASVSNAWQSGNWSEIGRMMAASIRKGLALVFEWNANLLGMIQWERAWDFLVEYPKKVLSPIVSVVAETIGAIDWAGAWATVVDVAVSAWDKFSSFHAALWSAVAGYAAAAFRAIDWRALWDGATYAAAAVAEVVAGYWSTMATSVAEFVRGIDWAAAFAGVRNAAAAAAGWIASALSAIDWTGLLSAGIDRAATAFQAVAAYVVSALSSIDWAGVWNRGAAFAATAFGQIGATVSAALGSVDWTGLISGASDAISGFFNRAADTLLSVDWGSLGYRLGEMIASGIAGILNIGRILMNSLTGDGASTAAGLGAAIANGILAFDWMGVGAAILRYIGAALQAGGEFILGVIGGLIGVADLGGAATNMVEQFLAGAAAMTDRLMASGQALAQAMWDGVIAKIDAMVEWFKGLPARIVEAIGSIDLGSLITWPKPPAWVSRLWGGGQEEEAPAPAADAAQGTTGEAASRITAEAAAANDNAQDAINTMLAGMDRLAGGVAQEGAAAVTAADAVGSAISDNISVTAMPVIDTSSIDAARTKVEALSRSLQSMPSTSVTATSAALAGARASGGPVKAGGSYLVGEEGPEIVTFGQDGFVHDAMKTARIIRNAALGAAGMAFPAAAMPAIPEIPTIEIAIPEVRLPVPPQLPTMSQPEESGGGGDRRMEVNIAAGAFVFNVAPEQSPRAFADEVERALSAKLHALSRGAFSDGAN